MGRGAWAALLLCGPAIAVGVVALVVSLLARDADPAFIAAQERSPVTRAALARAVVSSARAEGRPARGGSCRPGDGEPPLRNPWSCSVVDASGTTLRYVVRVRSDGSFRATARRGAAALEGRLGGGAGGG
jgi:hypothetical protein